MLRPAEATEAPVALLRRVCRPHLERLVERTRESANVVVPAGTEVRFIATVESDHVLRVGDRMGRSVPAHLASGGKAILAALPPEEVAELYSGAEEVDPARLRTELALVRDRGFAINDQRTETGVTAIGAAVTDASGAPMAALSLALPTARFDREALPAWSGTLIAAARRVAEDVAPTR
ncbi:hypothetical protein GCM10023405_39780 [Streptomonospora salina]